MITIIQSALRLYYYCSLHWTLQEWTHKIFPISLGGKKCLYLILHKKTLVLRDWVISPRFYFTLRDRFRVGAQGADPVSLADIRRFKTMVLLFLYVGWEVENSGRKNAFALVDGTSPLKLEAILLPPIQENLSTFIFF